MPVKSTVSLKNIYMISLSAIAANFAVPGKMGVPAKAILLKNAEGIQYSQVTPSLINELALEYSSILFFFIWAAWYGDFFKLNILQGAFFKGIIAVLLMLLILFIISFFLFKYTKKGMDFLQKLLYAFKLSAKRKDLFLIAFLITIGNLFLTFYADKILFKSLGFEIPYIFVIFSSSFSSIASLLSPLPGGIGIREIANGYFYKIFYDLGEIAVLIILIRRIINYISLLLLFIFERMLAIKVKRSIS